MFSSATTTRAALLPKKRGGPSPIEEMVKVAIFFLQLSNTLLLFRIHNDMIVLFNVGGLKTNKPNDFPLGFHWVLRQCLQEECKVCDVPISCRLKMHPLSSNLAAVNNPDKL